MAELKDARRRMEEAPERWALYLYGARRIQFLRFPYSVVYRVMEDRIQILAFAHHRQRAGYWRLRGRSA